MWPRERWWLSPTEIQEFAAVGKGLEAGTEIDAATDRFHTLVRGRALRMVKEVFAKPPDATLFAVDRDILGADPSPERPIADSLGIEPPEESAAERRSGASPTADERVERVLRVADEWGSGATLREFVARARRLGLQARGYQWTLTITPPTTKTLALIAMSPDQQHRGCIKTWVAPWAFAERFPSVPSDRFDDELGGIRGSLLDASATEGLRKRLEKALDRGDV